MGTECELCGLGEENELHLLMDCAALDAERKEMVKGVDEVTGGSDWRRGWEEDGTVEDKIQVMCVLLNGGPDGFSLAVMDEVLGFMKKVSDAFKEIGRKLVQEVEEHDMGLEEADAVLREMIEEWKSDPDWKEL